MSSFSIKNDTTWRDFLIRTGLIIASVVIIVWLMPRSTHNTYKIERGKPWAYADLKAPFDFPIYKSDEAVKAERDSLMKQYEPYYIYNTDIVGKQLRQFAKDYSDGIPGLSNDYISIVANRLRILYAQGIMNSSEYARLHQDTTQIIRVVSGKNAVSMPITKVNSVISAYEQIFLDPSLANHRDILKKCNLNDYLTPNLIYDKERSEASLNDLSNSIALASGLVQRGQKIIDRGDIVDSKTYNILQSYEKEMQRREEGNARISLTIMGQILLVFILISCLPHLVPQGLFRQDAFHCHALCADHHICRYSFHDGEEQHPACLYSAFCDGAHLHPCVYGLPHGIHGPFHHDSHLRQHPTISAGIHCCRTCGRTRSYLLAERVVKSFTTILDSSFCHLCRRIDQPCFRLDTK